MVGHLGQRGAVTLQAVLSVSWNKELCDGHNNRALATTETQTKGEDGGKIILCYCTCKMCFHSHSEAILDSVLLPSSAKVS